MTIPVSRIVQGYSAAASLPHHLFTNLVGDLNPELHQLIVRKPLCLLGWARPGNLQQLVEATASQVLHSVKVPFDDLADRAPGGLGAVLQSLVPFVRNVDGEFRHG